MWSDNETKLDPLDVSHLAAAVKHTILNPDLSPVTIGVFGDRRRDRLPVLHAGVASVHRS